MKRTQQAANRLADRTRDHIAGLWALVETGDLTGSQFRTQGAAVVARANVAGVNLADIGLTAELSRHLGRPTPPLGLRPTRLQVDQARMAADIDRITRTVEAPAASLGEWARSEPLLTVATAVQAGMQERGIERWTRGLSGTSCKLCTSWADGVARSVNVPMARHPGCDCIQQPAF